MHVLSTEDNKRGKIGQRQRAKHATHYGAIDGLRAYAAIGIVMMHIMTNGGYHVPEPLHSVIGSMGEFVYLFMVISGFSMCCGYFERISSGALDLNAFYGRRFKKILPFFALLSLFDLILSPSLESLFETFANLTLCFGLLPNPSMSVIGVGWFIGLVFVFYLLFPFFCWLLQSKRRAWLSFAVAFVFNLFCQAYFLNDAHVVKGFDFRTNIVYCAVYFIAGGLIYLYRERIDLLGKACKSVSIGVCLALMFVGVYFSFNTVLLVAVCVLLLERSITTRDEHRVLDNRFTKFIGGMSMEIYLCHMMAYRVIERVGLVAHLGNGILEYGIVLVLTIALALVVSVLFNRALHLFPSRAVETKR